MEPDPNHFLTYSEVAERLGVRIGDVRRLAHSGQLVSEPFVTDDGQQKVGIRQWRVAAWLLDHPKDA